MHQVRPTLLGQAGRLLISGLLGAGVAIAEGTYSPYVSERSTWLFWGDTHLHTTLSADAYMNHTLLAPADAYRFARGKTVRLDGGMEAKLRQPLDFLVVSDHAEYLGIYSLLRKQDLRLQDWQLGRRWADHMANDKLDVLVREFADAIVAGRPEELVPDDLRRSIWKQYVQTADQFNEPGYFTAFIGWEWTSMIGGDNLHRVVLLRDGADLAQNVLPFSAQESTDPESLWAFLERYESETGGRALAIPHNGNVSNGRMFAPTELSGEPLSRAYASARQRWEPLYEVTQVKGDAETHPYLSPADEFADFETWDAANIMMTENKEPWMLQYEYARSALREGLRHAQTLSVNPFKFGMIGSTDSHTGVSTAEENNFFGKFVESQPQPDRIYNKMSRINQEGWELGASGLAAIWARENTREALFEAMQRREVYATTGSRIGVRFFGGWHFDQLDAMRPDIAGVGYSQGVPMGGDLLPPHPESGVSPVFLFMASKDPEGANLDRVQIVKGWVDDAGETHELVHDVAISDATRRDSSTGEVAEVGSTINLEEPGYSNTIGVAQLSGTWKDPNFDPAQSTFYYLRVLEIPTPRWTAYDAEYFEIDMPAHVPMDAQDRAYTSPIWYAPKEKLQ